MSAIFLLIAASLLVAVLFLGAFLWATSTGQYDDDYANSVRILFDDEKKVAPKDKQKSTDSKSQ
ncbi:MAG: cbb3-type cytochrome oxidase assembly protein CcoS [Cryomorphaceae bacterium]|nr:MAG: cbb3-type cytochrome oxidase assembly protein CcoS [Cryomorphaceae bacterium]